MQEQVEKVCVDYVTHVAGLPSSESSTAEAQLHLCQVSHEVHRMGGRVVDHVAEVMCTQVPKLTAP